MSTKDSSGSRAELSILIKWIGWFSVILVVMGIFFLVLYALLGSPASLLISAVMLLIFLPVALFGLRSARSGRPGLSLGAVAFCSWSLALLVSARGHTALPAALPLVLIPMIFAVPYVNRRHLLLIACGAVATSALASALTIGPPLMVSRLDETTLAIIMVPIIMIATGLAVFGLWYVGSALRSSLHETERINLRLANSERELERKVKKRTRALSKAIDELSDIDEISRSVNIALELDEVLDAMQSALQRVLHFDNTSLILLDAKKERLMVKHAAGFEISSPEQSALLQEGVSAVDEDCIFTIALNRKRPILIEEIKPEHLAAMSHTDRMLHEANPVRSLLVCPLELKGQSIGVLSLGRKHETMSLSAEEISRIQRYIAPLAIVIRNAHLFEAAESARAEAMASDQAKSQFLANMSHELRTPLNAIIGFCELLAEEAEEAGDTQYLDDLEKIRNAGRNLLELISGVLDLTRIEAGKLQIEETVFDVRRLLDDLVTTYRPLAETGGNRLDLSVEGELGSMRTDETKLRQILVNLLGNAFKFTHHGRIVIGARREQGDQGDHLILEVADTGIGISAEQVDRIFEAFTQADESTSRRYGGTGLGLTISKQFCQLLGGSITVKSEEGKGSKFTVRLPAES